MSNKPKHFLVFKIIGIAGVLLAMTGIALVIIGFGNFESNLFLIGGVLMPIGFMSGVIGLFIGFSPEIAIMRTKSIKYIQTQNKDDLADIAENTAEITSGMVKTTVRAMNEAMRDTVYCKHCGATIDSDSKFCSSCGKEL